MKRARCVAGMMLFSCMALGAGPAGAAGWALQRMAPVPGAASTYPVAVSCAAADSCVAVGFYLVTVNSQLQDQFALAEEWSGVRWTISPVPVPSGASSISLADVSCASADSCVAVGSYLGGSLGNPIPLIERWDGQVWRLQDAPSPDSAQDSQLNGVSCTAEDSCIAVGFADPLSGSFREQLVERWNGSVWSIEQTPAVNSNAALQSVSCLRGGCVAVGAQGLTNATFAEQYKGGTWSVLPTAPAADTTFSMQLDSVSCLTMTACVAVGPTRSNRFNDRFSHVVEGWNGARWSLEAAPVPSHARFANQLSSVSCAGRMACVAVGWSGRLTRGLILRRRGSRWRLQSAPPPSSSPNHGAILAGVSCRAPNVCTAVGYYSGENGTLPYAERYSSTR